MKILLINPPLLDDTGSIRASTPSIGLLYLASYLEKNNYSDIRIVDADAGHLSWQDLKNLIIEDSPDTIGITGSSFALPALIKTAKISKEVLSDCTVVVGGFGPTKEPEKVLKMSNRSVDFIVMGEGELTFLELVQKLENSDSEFKNVDGLAYLDKKDELIITKPRAYIKDLDSIPWPAYHFLEPHFSGFAGMHAQHSQKEMKPPIATMFASRGCPHRCTFCSLGSKMYRQRSPKDIVAEMEFYRKEFKVNSIQVYDDEFMGLSSQQNKWIEEICDEIIKKNLHKKLAFLVQARCSKFIELKTLKKMKEANFVWIWWGVESGSQKILDFIKKDIKVEDVVRAFDLTKKAGMKSLMFVMIGFPKETPADIKLTVDLIKELKPNEISIHIVSPYPGSELRKYLEDHNLLETDDYYKFDSLTNVIHHTEEMTAEEIKKYYQMLVFRFRNGYWYFVKFWFKSLFSIDGWKKIPKRIKMVIKYILGWAKIGF